MSFLSPTKLFLFIMLNAISLMSSALATPQKLQTFRICAEPTNLPMSDKTSRSGYEIEVAELLAKEMGQQLDIQWIPQRDHSYFRQSIMSGKCDAIMGVPAGFMRLATTQPWYRTGFVFITRDNENLNLRSFDEPILRSQRIGVPATGLGDTPPAIALTRRGLTQNMRPYSIYEPHKMINALIEKEIDVAILWGPFAGWYAGKENGSLHLQAIPDRDGLTPMAFDMYIGVRKGNEILKKKLNRALIKRHSAIADILNKWRVPLRKN
jgi:mxaJ protein